MEFTVTVVNSPDGLGPMQWRDLRRRAPGAYPHELRYLVDADHRTLSGAALETALRSHVETLRKSHLRLRTGGRELSSIGADDALLKPGMVIVVGSEKSTRTELRATPLTLLLDTGPDSGRLIPLGRGHHLVGRAGEGIQIADPYVSRTHCELHVTSLGVKVESSRSGESEDLSCNQRFTLGTTEAVLIDAPPEPISVSSWPPSPATLTVPAPEGRHRMMLAMACVPLVVGIVLVMVTGLWFFLLFSVASALVASGMTWHAAAARKRYRRDIQRASQQWAETVGNSLTSPGALAHCLSASDRATILSHGAADIQQREDQFTPSPVVRLGLGYIDAEVEPEPTSSAKADDRLVRAPVALSLVAGECTSITGPTHSAQALMRWLLVQLASHHLKPSVVILRQTEPAASPLLSGPMLRDHAHLEVLDNTEALNHRRPGTIVIADAALSQLRLQEENALGHHVIQLTANDSTSLPGHVVNVNEATVSARATRTDPIATELIADGVSAQTAEELLRRSLTWQPPPTHKQLPTMCRLPLDGPGSQRSSAETLLCDLGISGTGRQQLDLVADGPHMLVAGTTGSGKSELLKSLLLSAAARYGPHQMNMVLFDFKGGAAFQKLAELKHTVGLITDLSLAQAERTLEGIRSELTRREKLFLEAGANDYTHYRQLQPEQPLARLLVVIDEFRIFTHELSDAMDELMRLASLGRSLGLHLILSTQRPQGVVTADIRANMSTAICLRVRSEDESVDLLGTAQAAHIPRNLPGRALLRRAAETPIEFHTAQMVSARQPVSVRPEHGSAPIPELERGPQNHELIAEILTSAGNLPHSPLLPPLPDQLLASEGDSIIGLVDNPHAQQQWRLTYSPETPRSMALIGESGSGASGCLAAAAQQTLADTHGPDLYILDGDGSLSALSDAESIGSYLTPEHIAEAAYLIAELTKRSSAAQEAPKEAQRHSLLLVSGWGKWQAADQMAPNVTLEHDLITVAEQVIRLGVTVMISGSRELALGRIASRCPHRIYLPYATSEDERNLWPKLKSVDALPGRGVLLSPDVASPGLAIHVAQPSDHFTPAAVTPPRLKVQPLPEVLPHKSPQESVPQEGMPVGLAQFTGAWHLWKPESLALILGSPGTGRTSCLRLLQQLHGNAQLLHGAEPWDGTDLEAPLILIDEATQCHPAQHQAITEFITQGGTVVATATAQSGVFTQVPWFHHARSNPHNVLLSPVHRSESEAFATSVPLLPRTIPGRAVHLLAEGPRMVQWMMPNS